MRKTPRKGRGVGGSLRAPADLLLRPVGWREGLLGFARSRAQPRGLRGA